MKVSIRRFVIVVAVALTATAVFSTATHAQVNAFSGKSKLTFTKREMIPVGDVDGHVIGVAESTGTNENTGKWEFLSGATTGSRSILDLTKGSGTQTGYFTLSKDASAAICKYTGTVKTVLSPDGKPLTTYLGEWKWVKCTGALEGCTGQGIYEGKNLSETEILVEYRGIMAQ